MRRPKLPIEMRKGPPKPVATLPSLVIQRVQAHLEDPEGGEGVKEEVCRVGHLVVLGPAGKGREAPYKYATLG